MKPQRSFVLFVCLLAGCHSLPSAEDQIETHISATCHASWPCQLDLRGSTSFQWDALYAFKYNASKAEIENATRVSVANYEELTRYLVFEKDGKVVRIESEPTNVEHPIKNEVAFDMPDTSVYRVFSANTEFVVTQEHSEAGLYFLLKAK
jgi:hypothetical protein